MTILLLENHPIKSDSVRAILEDLHLQVLVSDRITQALPILRDEKIDLIISNFHMPDGNGRTLHQLVRKGNPELANRIIFLSENENDSARYRVLQAAGCQFLGFPLKTDDVEIALAKARKSFQDLGRGKEKPDYQTPEISTVYQGNQTPDEENSISNLEKMEEQILDFVFTILDREVKKIEKRFEEVEKKIGMI